MVVYFLGKWSSNKSVTWLEIIKFLASVIEPGVVVVATKQSTKGTSTSWDQDESLQLSQSHEAEVPSKDHWLSCCLLWIYDNVSLNILVFWWPYYFFALCTNDWAFFTNSSSYIFLNVNCFAWLHSESPLQFN